MTYTIVRIVIITQSNVYRQKNKVFIFCIKTKNLWQNRGSLSLSTGPLARTSKNCLRPVIFLFTGPDWPVKSLVIFDLFKTNLLHTSFRTILLDFYCMSFILYYFTIVCIINIKYVRKYTLLIGLHTSLIWASNISLGPVIFSVTGPEGPVVFRA